MVEELLLVGADIIKVGIGPGSVCTTRKQTGVGYPQLSACIETADAAHGLGGHIMADGGITCPGDLAKAFGAGSDFAMVGGLFAGHDESGGELIERGGKRFKAFYGMSSAKAMVKHSGGVSEYRSSEGKVVEVPYRGPIAVTALDMLGGLRSACTYVGAAALKELSKRTTFVRVSAQLNETFATLYQPPTEHGYKLEAPAAGGAGAGGAAGEAATPTAEAAGAVTAVAAAGGAGAAGGASGV
jgi:GMP reductase